MVRTTTTIQAGNASAAQDGRRGRRSLRVVRRRFSRGGLTDGHAHPFPTLGRAGHPALRPAFSLAELMVALTILAFGLLIIGAALPIGMQRTRETAELAVADATLDYAFGIIESRVRLAKDDSSDYSVAPRRDNVFRPRQPSGRLAENAWPRYEPWIKVRPLPVTNISIANVGSGAGALQFGEQILTAGMITEIQVQGAWKNIYPATNVWPLESFCVCEMFPGKQDGWLPPALSALESVFPSVELDAIGDTERYTPEFFFDQNDNKYERHLVQGTSKDDPHQAEDGQETLKATERRVSWVTMYRRVSYASDSDPMLYEFLVFAVQRPTVRHRFAMPRVDVDWDTMEPEFDNKDAALLPLPVLVTFDNKDFPLLKKGSAAGDDYEIVGADRVLHAGFQDHPNLRFIASEQVGRILPKDSIIIPAVNDRELSAYPGNDDRYSGFVPHAPAELPLYTVIERVPFEDGSTPKYEIVVAGNGYYPWADDENRAGEYWPVLGHSAVVCRAGWGWPAGV